MLIQCHTELESKIKGDTTARFNPYLGKYHIKTYEELKGQGIKFKEIMEDGRKQYIITENAFNKLCEKMDIYQELLLD